MSVRTEALAVLVRAPVGVAYAVLTDVDGWDAWWPGCRTRRDDRRDGVGTGTGGVAAPADHHHLRLPVGRRGLRCRVVVDGWRHDRGLRAALRAGVDADAEWWLEPVADGTVVHLLVAARGRGGGRVVRALGDGLQALKDHLELAVAVAAGRVP